MTQPARPADFGRVAEDGTVYVITSDGERVVGQVPDATSDAALAIFVRRFEALDVEVSLLEQRVGNGALGPEDARRAIATARGNIEQANAVGDLAGLLTRLDALAPVLSQQAEARRAQRAQQNEETRAAKEAMVAEAEELAAGTDWRGGVNRFRTLLEGWKALPRIDRATDDALWHRFSAARTTYTRRRKVQFAEQAQRRETARKAKEEIIAEAEQIADSTDWGLTSAEFRDLMARWKAAGPAPRDVDDALWARFRGLQDQFFSARQSAQREQSAEFADNLAAKEELLARAEAEILPVTDVQVARAAHRTFLEQFNALGKVPREAIRGLDNRIRALDSAIQKASDEEWRRTDPEARARAADTVSMLETEIERLRTKAAKAEDRGDSQAAAKAMDSIATYQTWLEQAQKALAEFS
ncbi:DUF349 domain-containing protein [Propionicicella superfundia]|uniref:DUF349 domain-containing protein n=1 Tax=Propionicicella superfundia TaxID=348582 RepID=UPI000413488E|nr:DUF349 domain-containing protein [Propionicicella superfundia]